MLTLLLALALPVADELRESAVLKYKALLAREERAYLDSRLQGAKRELAESRRGVIDPSSAGVSQRMIDRGGGVVIPAKEPLRFGSADDKRTAIANAEKRLAVSESDLGLWKAGKYRPPVTVPTLEPSKLSVGQVGHVFGATLVSRDGETTAIVRFQGSAAPSIVDNLDNSQMPSGESFLMRDVFWVSGKRTIGKQTMFVLEPLPLDVEE